MALAFGSAGSVSSAGTTSLSVPYPSSISAGDLLVMCIVNKQIAATPTTPSGWTLRHTQTGGYPDPDAGGSNSGHVRTSIYTKVADGTESGNLSVTITSGNSAGGRMFRYTGSGSYEFDSAGGDAEYGWTNNIYIEVDPSNNTLTGVDVASGDLVLIVYGSNSARIDLTNNQTHTQSGATFSAATIRTTANGEKFSIGNNCSLWVAERSVTAGSSSAAITTRVQNTSQASDDPCGAIVVLRMREAAGGTNHAGSAALDGNGTFTADGDLKAAGSATLSGEGTLSATSKLTARGAATLSGEGTLGATASLKAGGSSALDGTGTLTAAGGLKAAGAASLDGTGTFVADGDLKAGGAAALSGEGVVTATAKLTAGGAAALSGEGTLTAVAAGGTTHQVTAALDGTATLSATPKLARPGAATLSGEATLSANALVVRPGASSLDGTGTLTATGAVTRPGSSALDGTATLTASATLTRGGASALSGEATLTASARATYAVSAAMDGTLTFTAVSDEEAGSGLPTTAIAMFDTLCTMMKASDSLCTMALAPDVTTTDEVI